MTTYGIWAVEEKFWWWNQKNELFHTTSLGLAWAQAIVVQHWHTGTTWKACAIGENGLPIKEETEEKGMAT